MVNFSKQEKTYLIWGSLVLAFFCAIQFIFLPALARRDDLKNQLTRETDSLRQIKALQKEYTALVKKEAPPKDLFGKRDNAFTLFSFLSIQAQKSGVKDNVVSMQPSSKEIDDAQYNISRVTIKLARIYLKELVNFLSRVEMPETGVKISSLSLTKTGDNNKMIDAVIEAETLILKESS